MNAAYATFRSHLLASTEGTKQRWGARSPDTLTGLCPRRFPVNAAGQVVLSLDERLWAQGRMRYMAREARR